MIMVKTNFRPIVCIAPMIKFLAISRNMIEEDGYSPFSPKLTIVRFIGLLILKIDADSQIKAEGARHNINN